MFTSLQVLCVVDLIYELDHLHRPDRLDPRVEYISTDKLIEYTEYDISMYHKDLHRLMQLERSYKVWCQAFFEFVTQEKELFVSGKMFEHPIRARGLLR